MKTPWTDSLDRSAPWPEYPRPQLRRASYLNLNGPWQYAITGEGPVPEAFDGTILVPFSPECALSGVGRTLRAGQILWYHRQVSLPEGFALPEGRLLLHFCAVDQEAFVYVNGAQVARHTGGYTAFTADVTQAVGQASSFTLLVRVTDDTDASWHSRGKQSSRPGGIWYTPQSGVWQTVWMEAAPRQYVTGLTLAPSAAGASLTLTVHANENGPCEAVIAGQAHRFPANQAHTLPIPQARLWSPEDPYLYPLALTFGQDQVESYFGLRDTEIRADSQGVPRLFLNGKPYFHNGLLDQGYWPDGLYTAPCDEALVFDIQTAKDMGFNLLRKHIKVENQRWYYHCDRLGMLVWQDMPSGGGLYNPIATQLPLITHCHWKDSHYRLFARRARQGQVEYRAELAEMVSQLGNAPSLVLWVPFNEGWGQFDAAQITRELQALDPTRPIDPASGWNDQGNGQLRSWHVYFAPYRFRPDRKGRAVALSEFGGYNLAVEGHGWSAVDYGYRRISTAEGLWRAYENLYRDQVLPAMEQGLAAAIYTQLTDVETEQNGLLTYDRQVMKLPLAKLQGLNQALRAPGQEAASKT